MKIPGFDRIRAKDIKYIADKITPVTTATNTFNKLVHCQLVTYTVYNPRILAHEHHCIYFRNTPCDCEPLDIVKEP